APERYGGRGRHAVRIRVNGSTDQAERPGIAMVGAYSSRPPRKTARTGHGGGGRWSGTSGPGRRRTGTFSQAVAWAAATARWARQRSGSDPVGHASPWLRRLVGVRSVTGGATVAPGGRRIGRRRGGRAASRGTRVYRCAARRKPGDGGSRAGAGRTRPGRG